MHLSKAQAVLRQRATWEAQGWCIELIVRNLTQRLQRGVIVLLMFSLCLLALTESAWAQPAIAYPTEHNTEEIGPDDPRLLKQMLNSEQARQSMQQLLEQPPFHNYKVVTKWHFGEFKEEQAPNNLWFKPLEKLHEWFSTLSFTLHILLWTGLFLLSAALLWHYRQWLQTCSQKWLPCKHRDIHPVQTLFGLDISNDSLADNWLEQAENLWPSDPHAALSLLYRGLLNHLLEVHALPLTDAHTEGEVLQMMDELAQPLQHYSAQLTGHWQRLAWGQHLPDHPQFIALCQQWQQLHSKEAA